jgi:hypothetical protein
MINIGGCVHLMVIVPCSQGYNLRTPRRIMGRGDNNISMRPNEIHISTGLPYIGGNFDIEKFSVERSRP